MARQTDGLTKRCDCPPRQWAKCDHSWHFAFKFEGTRHRFSLDRYLGHPVNGKTEAIAVAEQIRTAIRAGEFREDVSAVAQMTLGQLLNLYHERYITRERPRTASEDRGQIQRIARVPLPRISGTTLPFGEWVVADITTDTIERFREVRREHGGGVVGVNRNLALLRACFNWAIRMGHQERTPFKRGTETVVRLSREVPRSRRLEGDEEHRLLHVCGDHLRAVVEAALETGMRVTEILSLQWRQIRWTPRAEIFLPAQKTKATKDRRIPMSTRLQAVIEMRRVDPAGHAMPIDGYVFGDEIGEPVKSIKRAWGTAVLKSHGKTPTWAKGASPPRRGDRAPLPRPPPGGGLTLAGGRGPAPQDQRLARPREHRADEHVPGRHRNRRRRGHAAVRGAPGGASGFCGTMWHRSRKKGVSRAVKGRGP